jgi:hypothetical protein
MMPENTKMTPDQLERVRAEVPFCMRFDLGNAHQLALFLRIKDGEAIAHADFAPTEPPWTDVRIAEVRGALYQFRRAVERRIGEEVYIEFGGRRV